MVEALCTTKFKFPYYQKIHISKKWGFTEFHVGEFENMVADKQLIADGYRSDTSLIMTPGPMTVSAVRRALVRSLPHSEFLLCAQSCPTLCDPMDCSLPSASIHGIFQATILEWVAISYSRGSS